MPGTQFSAYPSDISRSNLGTFRHAHSPTDNNGARIPVSLLGRAFKANLGPLLGAGVPFTAASWTIVNGGTGDASAQATTPGGGLIITTPSDDNFDMTHDWACGAITPTSGIYYFMNMRYQQSHATQVGFKIGMTTGGSAAALPFGTNYTDCICFTKAIASANITGEVRGNSGTTALSSTIGTCVAATEIELGFWCYLHATLQAGSWFVNGTETAFDASQLTQLAAILTTPPTMYWTVHHTGTTGNTPTATVTSLVAGESIA